GVGGGGGGGGGGGVGGVFGGAAGAVTLDDEDFRAVGGGVGAVRELAGETQFAHGRLARDPLVLPTTDAFLGALHHEIEELVGLHRVAGQPVVELVLHGVFDNAGGFRGGKPVLGLALELGLADEHREHRGGAGHDVFARHLGGALALVDALGMVLEGARKRRPQPGLVGAAVGSRDGVAVGRQESVGVGGPGHRPFD